MVSPHEIEQGLVRLRQLLRDGAGVFDRLTAEVAFANELCDAYPEERANWERLIAAGLAAANRSLSEGVRPKEAVAKAEAILAPIAQVAKQYTIHCVGHAHVDMNWMWDWPETVATTNDTFTTVDRLMEEFPAFRFSQSQASVYQIMKDYLPELYAKVKQRISEGRWEVTASTWVEGSKNLASGEILCRHLLYTKRFLNQEFGIPYDAIKIDWEPDTFGHAHTVPSIITKGGISRYYFHRGAAGPQLFWWQGKDGSRVLAFDDRARGYNGRIGPDIVRGLVPYARATGLKDWLFVYGVGDHGGGPTRRDLIQAEELATWPVFPDIKLSTTEEFYSAVERQASGLPVVDCELNYVFEGCYTSESNIKFANRKSESALVEAEMAALLGRAVARMPYPSEDISLAWRHAMFNQFHDILPGSGVRATYQYAQGLFQEVMARTTMMKTRSFRAIAARVNTASCCAPTRAAEADLGGVGPGIGGGPGDLPAVGGLSRRGGDVPWCDPFVVFNPSPWKRSEVVTARLWERDWEPSRIVVADDAGNVLPAQVLSCPNTRFWTYRCTDVAFPVTDVEGLGYRTYAVMEGPAPPVGGPCTGDGKGAIENEFLKVQVDPATGAIAQLLDKRTDLDLVPTGERLGVLEYLLEAPHSMTAWIIGQIVKVRPLTEGAVLEYPHQGPYLAAVTVRRRYGDSSFALTVSLSAGVPRVDFTLEMDWLERGSPEIGVPMLRIAFPLAIEDTLAAFECANGHVERPTDASLIRSLTTSYDFGDPGVDRNPGEVPVQRWADLVGTHRASGRRAGATLVNDSKYGHRVDGGALRLTLLRSSYDPDPLPELGPHTIRFALYPHAGDWSTSDATRVGYDFNLPVNAVSTTWQSGSLPGRKGFAELLTPNAMLSGMKKAEDSDALIVRLYEMEGKATTAQLRLDACLAAPGAPAVETDLLEQPLVKNTARMKDGVLSVRVPPFGLVAVKIG